MSLSGDTTQSSLSAPAQLVPLNSNASPHSLSWARPSHPAPLLREGWPKNDTRLLANLSLLGHHDDCHMSPVLTASLVVWYSVTMVLGLVGNIGLICIISRCREKANVTSIFICNLSFSDILVCVFCLPFTVIYTIMDHWVFGELMCRLLLSNEPYTNVPMSKSSLSARVSAEAYNASFSYTNTSAQLNSFRSLFSYAPPAPHMEACMEHWPSPKQRLAYTTWLLVFQYCGPLLLVLLCYVRVFVRLKHRKDMLDRVRTPESQRVTHSRRINIMLVALITAFALCWLPLTVFNVLSDWKQEVLPVCHHNLLFSLCHLLAMSSTCINPIIYGFLNSNFRQEVRDVILHCRWRLQRSQSITPYVVAYVDVWSSDKTANYSKPFVQQLEEMGAQVTKRFNKQVTHVIFSNGHPATWRKAKQSNVKLVSVLWVGSCYDEAAQVNEDLFPAINETNSVLKHKKHRCMLPKDMPEKNPGNDKRMRNKLDKMMKDITPVKPLVTDFSPIIIDEETGIIYSPGLKRSDYMARRLKDMKEKHEKIFSPADDPSDEDSSPSVAETASAAESPAKEEGTSLPNIKDSPRECSRRETAEQPWMSPFSQALLKKSISSVKCPSFEVDEEKDKKKQTRSRRASDRISIKRNRTEPIKTILFTDSPDTPGTSDSKRSSKKTTRKSITKSSKSASEELELSSSKNASREEHELTKEDKSCTETKTTVHENVNYTDSISTAAATGCSIKTTSPKPADSKLTSIFSALVRPPSLPCESRKIVSCSTDGDDDVFEDYFSPANLKQKPKKALSSGLSTKTIQLPFELNSDTKKKTTRKSQSAVNKTNLGKKNKSEQSLSHLKDVDRKDSSEKLENLLSDLAGSSDDTLKQLTKKRRQSALPFTSIYAPSTSQHRRVSLPVEPMKSEETDTALEPRRKPDSSLQSDSVTSRGNEDAVASELTQTEEGSSLQTMVHTTKAERTLVMTSMPTDKQSTVVQVVKALGGFTLVDEVCASTTHVVSGGHRRTLNILLGIARGCWILSFEWILWSLEKRQWIPEEPYELSDQFPAAQV
ncbi:hypothetical protein WMY93_007176 [Mugilogobius chulae]|uniref:G-protein coupled receptors family 1 profile domain-containing protein n=1 Tax=Mugilogobius chulae TaxID=88201 RepID=A0AAW0PQK2_9GOBI